MRRRALILAHSSVMAATSTASLRMRSTQHSFVGCRYLCRMARVSRSYTIR